MKAAISLLILFVSFLYPPNLSHLREEYPKANSSEAITDQLYEKLSSVNDSDPMVLVAYKGAVSTLKAKYAKGIKNKKEFFKAGKSLLESAVQADPKNIEIRCLRLSVQENSPKIVGYKNDMDEDKKFILDHYKHTDSKEVKEFVKNYVHQSPMFEDFEKQLF